MIIIIIIIIIIPQEPLQPHHEIFPWASEGHVFPKSDLRVEVSETDPYYKKCLGEGRRTAGVRNDAMLMSTPDQ